MIRVATGSATSSSANGHGSHDAVRASTGRNVEVDPRVALGARHLRQRRLAPRRLRAPREVQAHDSPTSAAGGRRPTPTRRAPARRRSAPAAPPGACPARRGTPGPRAGAPGGDGGSRVEAEAPLVQAEPVHAHDEPGARVAGDRLGDALPVEGDVGGPVDLREVDRRPLLPTCGASSQARQPSSWTAAARERAERLRARSPPLPQAAAMSRALLLVVDLPHQHQALGSPGDDHRRTLAASAHGPLLDQPPEVAVEEALPRVEHDRVGPRCPRAGGPPSAGRGRARRRRG